MATETPNLSATLFAMLSGIARRARASRFPLRDFVELSLCSTRPAPRARRGKTCRRKFADDAALELRKGTADMEEEPAAGRRRVHRFCHGLEADTFAVEQLDRFDELLDAAGQPVEFPYNENVALAHVIKGAGELGRSRCAPEAVSVKMRSHPAAFSASTSPATCPIP